ncbi:G-protein coupled receptor 35, partial [Nestor notabilis]
MNLSSCSITAYESFPLVQLCVYIPVLLLGILLNVLALWVFCCELSKWTETRVYTVILAVADCLLLFTMPSKTLSQFHQLKVSRWCLVLDSSYCINHLMSISIITVIAADGYLAIRYPLKTKVLRPPLKEAFAPGFLWMVMICVMYHLIILSYCSMQVTAELMRKNGDCQKEKVFRKAIYIVSANTAVFIICFLPLYFRHLLCFMMDSISSNCSAIQRVNN